MRLIDCMRRSIAGMVGSTTGWYSMGHCILSRVDMRACRACLGVAVLLLSSCSVERGRWEATGRESLEVIAQPQNRAHGLSSELEYSASPTFRGIGISGVCTSGADGTCDIDAVQCYLLAVLCKQDVTILIAVRVDPLQVRTEPVEVIDAKGEHLVGPTTRSSISLTIRLNEAEQAVERLARQARTGESIALTAAARALLESAIDTPPSHVCEDRLVQLTQIQAAGKPSDG